MHIPSGSDLGLVWYEKLKNTSVTYRHELYQPKAFKL